MTNAQRRKEIVAALLTGALKELPAGFKDPLEAERLRMALKKMKRKFKRK